MSSISPVQGSYQGSQVASSQSSALDQSAFLKLLVTQLANQDPLNPMDNQEFAAQLAQYSSLEQLTKVNTNLESSQSLSESMALAMQSSMASNLIGREIVAVDDRLVLSGEDSVIHWESDGEATQLTVRVLSELGVTVHEFEADVSGEDSLVWDGRVDGVALPEGTYTLQLEARDAAGAELAVRPMLQGVVESVRYLLGEAWLMVNGLDIGLGQVGEVRAAGESNSTGATGWQLVEDDGTGW